MAGKGYNMNKIKKLAPLEQAELFKKDFEALIKKHKATIKQVNSIPDINDPTKHQVVYLMLIFSRDSKISSPYWTYIFKESDSNDKHTD